MSAARNIAPVASPTVTENASLNGAILERGVFYYPAGLHYGNPDAPVTCDRCRRTGIPACIGFERYDYCVTCVDAVVHAQPTGAWRPGLGSRVAPSPVMTLMMQNDLRPPREITVPPRVAAMEQGMFTTRMMDSIYRGPSTR